VQQTFLLTPDADHCTLSFRLVIDGVPKMAEQLARTPLGWQVPQMLTCLGAATDPAQARR
jgi:hypothetical protein